MGINDNRVGYSEVVTIHAGTTFHHRDRSKELKILVRAKDDGGGTSEVVV
ncbi:hypothetical protein MA16_Dca020269 [Dendrobium catenatum]|uniref:Uncharacterized protein n=1 Tax=Dendrobium catenatum TaxID=906689 RepID=A0A2I0WAY6_9ASPA|nr:hypothetical protein MA16_Dca020269 [Dendrobium catenatum]